MKIKAMQYSTKAVVQQNILSRLNVVSVKAINTDSYIDYMSDIIKSIDWKNSKIVEKVKVIMHMAEATIDYFDEFVAETDDAKRIDALVDAALLAWHFTIKEFDLKIPSYITMFEDKFAKFILTATYMFIRDKKWKKNTTDTVATDKK